MEFCMFLERLGKRLIIFLLAFFLSWSVIAHPHTWQHIQEMYSVLPFATYKNGDVVVENFPIRGWLEKITQDLIDDYNRVKISDYGGRTFYAYLQDELGFSLGFGDHRILFHWGYNAEPWNEALNNYVIQHDWDISKIDRFKETLRLEQKRRNGIANKEAEKVFGFASGGKEAEWANSILSIVYDVHLLGDYTEGDNNNFKGVTEPTKVAGDIISSIRRIDDSRTSRDLIESIREARGEISDQHKLAAKLIEILQKDLPDFLLAANEGTLKKKFENKGFKLTTKDPQYINFNSNSKE